MRRSWFIALSLANLCYLRVWSELLTYTRADTYLMKQPPAPAAYAAVMLDVLLAGGVLWLAGVLLLRRFPRAADFLLLFSLLLPLNGLRAVLSNRIDVLRSPLLNVVSLRMLALIAGVTALCGIAAMVRYHRRLARLAAAALVALFPFCAVTFAQAIWKIVRYNPSAFASKSPGPALLQSKMVRLDRPGSARVLWIIADEWDYRLSFVDRPASLELPQIDRLRADAVSAEQAFPPGPETRISMPGYFTGKLVAADKYDGPSELQLRFFGQAEFQPWSQQPSIFSRAQALGVKTALVDWFHPTCRILHGLTWCDWWEMGRQFNSMGDSLGVVMISATRSLFETTLLSAFGQSLAVHQQIQVQRQILNEGQAIADDPQYGLAVIHLPIPHAPHPYDRHTGTFTLKNSPIRGYIDSLALLDRTLGELRRSMESSGAWDRTVVILTSDHHYREDEALDGKTDSRIPFLVKTAGRDSGIVYSRRFNTVLTHDLILAFLRGELVTAADVARWLDMNRSRVVES